MSKRIRQLKFIGQGLNTIGDSFGGSKLTSHPKTKRPLDSKLPIHLILRATRGGMRLPLVFKKVNEQVERSARKYGVTIYQYANVGNHLHILIKLSKRSRWSAFIRELTGRIAQLVTEILAATLGNSSSGSEAENSHREASGPRVNKAALRRNESFWLHRPFTRVVRGWRKAFQIAKEYVQLNQLEADGMIKRSETKTLKDLRAIWSG